MLENQLPAQESQFRNKRILDNGVVLANVVELVSSTISKVNNKEVAYNQGDTVSRSVLSNLVATRLKAKLEGVCK